MSQRGRRRDCSGRLDPPGRLRLRARSSAETCGCNTGAAVALAATVLYLVALLLGWAGEVGPLGSTAGGALVFFLAGAVGKVVGLARARRRLVRVLLRYRPMFIPARIPAGDQPAG